MSNVVLYQPNAELFVKSQSSPSTRKVYGWALNVWFKWLGDRPVDTRTVIEFRDWAEATFKPRSAEMAFTTTRLFYRFIRAEPNPFDGVKAPRRVKNNTPNVPSDTSIDEMIDSCDSTRDSLILSLLLNGLRASEVGNLRRSDIEWNPQYGRDIIRVIGKGRKERLVPASKNTSVALRRWDGEHTPGEYLFGDIPMTLRQIEYVTEKWSEKSGKVFRPHKLRHHYATRLARGGVNPFVLKDLLGHENIATTMVYVRMNLSDAVAEVAKDPMDYVKVEQ